MSSGYLPKPYHSKLWRGIMEFGLIDPNDRVLIGLSGGKDSMFLTYALNILQSYSKIPFSFEAVTIDLGYPGEFDVDSISRYCGSLGVVHHVVRTQIARVVEERIDKASPCATCSYFRRASLNRFAVEHGFNKVALAHHQDDAVETFLMNIFYAGKLNTLPWKTHLTRSGVTVIRPMMYLSEKDVIKGSKIAGFRAVSNPCPYSCDTMRARVRGLILELARENRMTKANLVAAMRCGDNMELWPAVARHNKQDLC